MNTNQRQPGSRNVQRTVGKSEWWLGFGLVILTALAVAISLYNATALFASGEPARIQAVPDAAAQSVLDYLRVHSVDSSARPQAVPDAAAQGVLDYLRAHSTESSSVPQAVPDAAEQSVLDYLRLHEQ